jgi:hypothetical protein
MDGEGALYEYFTWAKNRYLGSRNVHLRSIVQQRLQTVATAPDILSQAYRHLEFCRILVRKSGRETTCI